MLVSACTILDAHRWPAGHKQILLTIDDGPNPRGDVSRRILDVLAEHEVKATFCLVGRNVERHPDILRKILSGGHDVVIHSYSRSTPTVFNYKRLLEDTEKTRRVFHTAAAQKLEITHYRPPRGLVTFSVRRLFRETNLASAFLTFYVHDAPTEADGASGVMKKIKRRITEYNGAAIVLHESRFHHTVAKDNQIDKTWLPAALDDFILWAKKEGYGFVQYKDEPANK